MDSVVTSSVENRKTAFYSEPKFHQQKRWNVKAMLVVAAVFFFATTAVFIGLFVHYYIKNQDRVSMSPAGQPVTEPNWGVAPTAAATPANVCTTIECVTAVTLMIQKMNLTADPCVDFDEFACGRFNKETVFPTGYTSLGSFIVIQDQNQLVMKDIISKNITQDDPKYLQNMKRYFKSCMDVEQIERNGLTKFFNDTYIQDWPLLNPAWNESTFQLNKIIDRYTAVDSNPLFVFSAYSDWKNSSRKILFLYDPQLGLSQEYYSRSREDTLFRAYHAYLRDLAVALGANESIAEQDVEGVIDLEVALAKIMPTKERQDINSIYNPVNVSQLAVLYPEFDLAGALRAAYDVANVSIADNETVINMFPAYLGNLSKVLANFSSRTIQNLFSFRHLLGKAFDMSQRLREITLEYQKVANGKTEASDRWQECLARVSSPFWKGMSKQFVSRTFSQQAKAYILEMTDNLRAAFKEIIDESSWMGPHTKQEAYKKLASMSLKIGYPDSNFTEDDIEKEYENFDMVEDDYYSNRLLINKLVLIEFRAAFRKPVDKNEWSMYPHQVNAYYAVSLNEIVFLAGVLQPPMFSETFQDYINYGGIGMVIGHEMTHGFDNQGSQFDAQGNLVNWWQQADRDVFKQKAKCIIDQGSSFVMDDINMTLNGASIHTESIADNGGLKESYRAYKTLVSRKGENPTLPGLDLTQDQLFFLAFGQLWCEKKTLPTLLSQVTSSGHPPGRFRTIGTLQNSEDFARAYNCPRGSRMNPEKKCNVW